MTSKLDGADATRAWWTTSITEISAEAIRIRGYAVEDLIGRASLGDMVWLLMHGELPTTAQSALLEAAMLGAVVHGPHAPSIAIARMAITCGMDMNHAIAHGASAMGDAHGGAIEQSMRLLEAIAPGPDSPEDIAAILKDWMALHGPYVPGFGHRFHRDADPRTARLHTLAGLARDEGVIQGRYLTSVKALEVAIAQQKGRSIPMNLDGIAAAVFLELGFSPQVGRGLIVVARSIGVLANAWEEIQQGGRLKGPVPRESGYDYVGPAARELPRTTQRGGKSSD